jgi:hypothetical protein
MVAGRTGLCSMAAEIAEISGEKAGCFTAFCVISLSMLIGDRHSVSDVDGERPKRSRLAVELRRLL